MTSPDSSLFRTPISRRPITRWLVLAIVALVAAAVLLLLTATAAHAI